MSDEIEEKILGSLDYENPTKLKAQLESYKVHLEARELKNKNESGFFKRKFVLESIIGGVVAAGLLAAWFIVYLEPMLSAQNKVAEEKEKIFNLRLDRFQISLDSLESAKNSLEIQKLAIADQKEKISEKLSTQSNKNDSLVTIQSTLRLEIGRKREQLEAIGESLLETTTNMERLDLINNSLEDETASAWRKLKVLKLRRDVLHFQLDSIKSIFEDLNTELLFSQYSPYECIITIYHRSERKNVDSLRVAIRDKLNIEVGFVRRKAFLSKIDHKRILYPKTLSKMGIDSLRVFFPDFEVYKNYVDPHLLIFEL